MVETMLTLEQRADLAAQLPALHREAWPRFFAGDATNRRYWPELYTTFPGFQIVLCDLAGIAVAAGHLVPFAWDGTLAGLPAGWDAVLAQAFADRQHGRAPTALSALAIVVAGSHRRQGLSGRLIRAMKRLAAEHRFDTLLAPVRPTRKSHYPLTPIDRYAAWTQADGSPFDPWLRAHWRSGAEQSSIAPRSMLMTGTVAEWERWTELRFPESGAYVVPGALQPIGIDREGDRGRYEDPNIWMRHPIRGADAENPERR